MVSWGYQDDFDSHLLTHHNNDSTYITQSNEAWIKRIKFTREAGYKVFVKPHVWLSQPSEGKWRSDIFPSNDENWEIWKSHYRDFIYRYARIAEIGNADMFCIGAELSRLAVEKPAFWTELIEEIRNIFSGELTYAANWHGEYQDIQFWNELDHIGVQAYFPLVEIECPTVDEISLGWQQYIPELEAVQNKFGKKVLFTELGYRSSTRGAIKPWEWNEHLSEGERALSLETQANCYEAFFNTIWDQDWFGGVHIWQFNSHYYDRDNSKNTDFTPQGKPAEVIIAKGFE